MGGVAGEEGAAGPPTVGDEAVEAVDDRPLDVVGLELAVGREHLAHELERGLGAGLAIAGVQHELVAAAALQARHDDVRAARVAVVHPVALAVVVAQRVDDEPRLVVGAAGHADAEALAHRRAATVGADREARLGAVRRAALRVLDAGALVVGDDAGHRRAELDAGAGPLEERLEQQSFELGLRERVLERVAEAEGHGGAGLHHRLAVGAVVAGAGARHDDREDAVADAGLRVGAQRLVVDRDRLRLVARAGVALEHEHARAGGGEEQRGREADRPGADDDDVGALDRVVAVGGALVRWGHARSPSTRGGDAVSMPGSSPELKAPSTELRDTSRTLVA